MNWKAIIDTSVTNTRVRASQLPIICSTLGQLNQRLWSVDVDDFSAEEEKFFSLPEQGKLGPLMERKQATCSCLFDSLSQFYSEQTRRRWLPLYLSGLLTQWSQERPEPNAEPSSMELRLKELFDLIHPESAEMALSDRVQLIATALSPDDETNPLLGFTLPLPPKVIPSEPVVEEIPTDPVAEEIPTDPVVEEIPTDPVVEEIPTVPVVEEIPTYSVPEELRTEPVIGIDLPGIEIASSKIRGGSDLPEREHVSPLAKKEEPMEIENNFIQMDEEQQTSSSIKRRKSIPKEEQKKETERFSPIKYSSQGTEKKQQQQQQGGNLRKSETTDPHHDSTADTSSDDSDSITKYFFGLLGLSAAYDSMFPKPAPR
jgi:hypothetical protein